MGNRHSGETRIGQFDQPSNDGGQKTTNVLSARIYGDALIENQPQEGLPGPRKPQSSAKPGFRLTQEKESSAPKNRTHSSEVRTRPCSTDSNQAGGVPLSSGDAVKPKPELESSSWHSSGRRPVENWQNRWVGRTTGCWTRKHVEKGKPHGHQVRPRDDNPWIEKVNHYKQMIDRDVMTNMASIQIGRKSNVITNATGDNDLTCEVNSCLQSIASRTLDLNEMQQPLSFQSSLIVGEEFPEHHLSQSVRRYSFCFPHKRGKSLENTFTSNQTKDGTFYAPLTLATATATAESNEEPKAEGDILEHNTEHSSLNRMRGLVAEFSDPLHPLDNVDASRYGRFNADHLLCTMESIENLDLLIRSMQIEWAGLKHQHQALQTECQNSAREVKELHARLSTGRSAGLMLEAANGRFITDSLKHKYLQAEKNQLKSELDRRKSMFGVKEAERHELFLEYDRLQRLKTYSQRQCQEALMESNLTAQQLREISNKCHIMEIHKDEGHQLRNMMYNLQEVMGRIRVIASLKSTVHESCLEYVSSSELIFDTPVTENGCEFSRARSSKGSDNRPVLCQLSHVVCPGNCSALEIYNDVSTTIDGVTDGLNALFVTAGPAQSGKTTTLFGELGNRSAHFELSGHYSHSRKRWSTTYKELKASLKRAAKCYTNQFMDISRSEEFASCFGLTGLCLVHLIQNLSIKSLIESQADDAVARPENHISVSVIMVPLDDHMPETDIITNNIARDPTWSGTEQTPVQFDLKRKSIASISEVILLCELIQDRLRVRQSNCQPGDAKVVPAHTVVIVRVEPPLKSVKGSKLTSQGFLILIDTVGLDVGDLNQGISVNPSGSQTNHAWKDVSAVAQIMRSNPNPIWFERNRLLRTLRHCVSDFWSQPSTGAACTLLLHLSCDRSQACVTMQCLRLGLWVMQLDRSRAECQKTSGHSAMEEKRRPGEEESKPRRLCVWRIGAVGQRAPSSRDCSTTRFTPSTRSSVMEGPQKWLTRKLSSSSFEYPVDNGDGSWRTARHVNPRRLGRNRSLR